MIRIIAGPLGGGKTTWLSWKMWQLKKLPEAEQPEMVSSFPVDVPGVEYVPEDALKLFSPAKDNSRFKAVFIDEAQTWFNSRDWENLPKQVQYLMQQHRHYRIDIYAATPNIRRIDLVMRELVGEYYEVRKLFGTPELKNLKIKNPWGLYTFHKFDVLDANLKRRGFAIPRFFIATKKIYSSFDTHQKFKAADETKKFEFIDAQIRICRQCGGRKVLSGKSIQELD